MTDELSAEDYQQHLAFCRRFDTWKLTTACSLITGGLPDYTGEAHPDPKAYHAVYEAAVSCAGESLPLVNDQVPVKEYRVKPDAFVHWAALFGIKGYPAFTDVMGHAVNDDKWAQASELKEFKRLFRAATGHNLPQNVAAKLREFDERRKSQWRCRGLAAYFWSLEPTLTTPEIINKPEVIQFGCDGRRLGERQVRDWIADLNPMPEPGRPKKKRA